MTARHAHSDYTLTRFQLFKMIALGLGITILFYGGVAGALWAFGAMP
jgi:hypothetical protein